MGDRSQVCSQVLIWLFHLRKITEYSRTRYSKEGDLTLLSNFLLTSECRLVKVYSVL